MSKIELNDFLVHAFHDILLVEERCLRGAGHQDLSIREVHLIDAVCLAVESGKDNRVTAIARQLGVTNGTLTVAVNALEKIGYLSRQRNSKDRRVVEIIPTEKAKAARHWHAAFHEAMVDAVENVLGEGELEALAHALAAIQAYFKKQNHEIKLGGI